MNTPQLSAHQLNQAANLQEQIEKLQAELASILGTDAPATSTATPAPAASRKRVISAAGLARIKAAQKARWSKIKAAKASKAVPVAAPVARKWKLSAAGLARIKAANKAYWARKKAAQNK